MGVEAPRLEEETPEISLSYEDIARRQYSESQEDFPQQNPAMLTSCCHTSQPLGL